MTQSSPDDDKGLLQLIKLTNFLSFGPETTSIDLKSLNIIIGINDVGKSNLIEAVALMRATPMDIGAVVRKGGGASEWIWKGKRDSTATIEVVVSYPKGKQSLVHLLSFYSENGRFQLNDETVENEYAYGGEKRPYFYYHFEGGHPIVNTNDGTKRQLAKEKIDPTLSILSQRRDPEHYPEISYLADVYGSIRIYREWSFGRNTVFREPQKADMRNDRLEEDFSNLGLFLNRMRQHPKAKKEILEGLGELYENLSDFDVKIEGGTVQVFLTENEFTIPATRLSDGTLRYLCLLAILCDPKPPSLICIEEPELGLHPDILPKLADYLVAASKRTQLIVTTHSDIIINAMSERPEVVLVCEKRNGCTEIRRLKENDLKVWLEQYRLGQLWIQGQLGGTRW
jgi:predicted ATPase